MAEENSLILSSKMYIHLNIQSMGETQLTDYWIAKDKMCNWSNTGQHCVTTYK